MVQILRRDSASLSPWWTVSWNFMESGVRRVEWKEGETSLPQISTLYQKKEKHCCRQYQQVPTTPTSWTGSKCSPLLKAAVGHQILEGIIHSEFRVYGTPWSCAMQKEALSFPYILPALPVFPDITDTGVQLLYSQFFAESSGRSLSLAWCRKDTSLWLFLSCLFFFVTQGKEA